MTTQSFTATKLRQEIITILAAAQKPLKAYDIISLLRETRPNAQPPTVYRVLEFLKNKDVVHEVSRQHTYVLCQNAEAGTEHEANLLLICTECDTVTEIFEAQLSKPLKKFSKQYDFAINCSTVELTGVCQQCQA